MKNNELTFAERMEKLAQPLPTSQQVPKVRKPRKAKPKRGKPW